MKVISQKANAETDFNQRLDVWIKRLSAQLSALGCLNTPLMLHFNSPNEQSALLLKSPWLKRLIEPEFSLWGVKHLRTER